MAHVTFEKVDLLPSIVSGGRQSERRVYVIGDGVEAHADVSRVVIVQQPVVKPPVFGPLTEVYICLNGDAMDLSGGSCLVSPP